MSYLLTPEGDHEVRGMVPRCQGKHYSIQLECEVIVAGKRATAWGIPDVATSLTCMLVQHAAGPWVYGPAP